VGLAVAIFHGILHGPEGTGVGGGSRGFYFHVILFFSVDTVLLILQDLVVVRERKARVELENAQLRMLNIEAMNLQMKQQVQPHFLFNSLSTLKSLIRYAPQDAEDYVLKLSGFLRNSLASHASTVVTVDQELSLCRDYLEMQRLRFGEALQFAIEAGGGGYLPVFALQALIENAIKHNVLTRERPLLIRVVREGESIRVSNNLQRRDEVETGGTGLMNLRERYRALGGAEPVVVENGNEFLVSISVLKHENRDHRG
jgi:LytS/YehU family sensor histidine kinase